MMQTKEQNRKKRQPIFMFYKPTTLSGFSNLSNICAWLNLIFAVVYPLAQIFFLNSQIDSYNLPFNAPWWAWGNLTSAIIMTRLMSFTLSAFVLASNFFLFKSISIGLNVLLEIGFTMTSNEEDEGDEEETENA